MTENKRAWKSSKVTSNQVNANTKNTVEFIELTEKYKTFGSNIEAKMTDTFNVLGSNFMNFDPNLTVQEELAKLGKQEVITNLLRKSLISSKLDFDKINNPAEHEAYAQSIANDFVSYKTYAKYLPLFMINDGFKKLFEKIGQSSTYEWESRAITNAANIAKGAADKMVALNANSYDELAQYISNQYSQDTFSPMILGIVYSKARYSTLSEALMQKIKQDAITSIVLLKQVIDSVDPTNATQLKLATDNLSDLSDKAILTELRGIIEAKNAFTKSVEELHNNYEASLNLDDRAVKSDSNAEDVNAFQKALNSFTSLFTSGSENEQKFGTETNDESKKEEGIFNFKPILNFFNPWAKSKVTEAKKETPAETDAEEEDSFEDTTITADSTKVAVYDEVTENKAAVAVKTLAVEAYESKEQVHKKYQALISTFMDAKKIICFSNVMQATKLSSSCLIRKPFEDVNSANKLDCETLITKAALGMKQCEYIFPFETASDAIILDHLDKASKVEVIVFEDGQTGLKSHVDQVANDITAGLGKAVLAHYMALPAGATEQLMTNAYNEQVVDGNGNLQLTAEVFQDSNSNAVVNV